MLRNHILGQASYLPFFEGDNGGGNGGGSGQGQGQGNGNGANGNGNGNGQGQNNGNNGNGGGRGQRSEAELLADIAATRLALENERGNTTALQKKLKDLEDALPQRIETARTEERGKTSKLRTRIINAELRAAASEAGLADNDLLGHAFFDTSKITVDDEGNVTGVKELFADVKTKKPDWFKAVSGNGSGNGNGAGAGANNNGGGTRVTGNGSPPPNNGNGNGSPPDAKTMKGPEYDTFKKDLLKGLRGAA